MSGKAFYKVWHECPTCRQAYETSVEVPADLWQYVHGMPVSDMEAMRASGILTAGAGVLEFPHPGEQPSRWRQFWNRLRWYLR